ncbi:hypothetical protein ACI01nite_07950 [Acetobacter cibinongensis]|uniref:Outer membrane protein n=1 Tax=Acetobacter cibinongensis TaxID=146475 RepID=A0A0D6N3G6_9PROT|nr:Hint domain-containing protein [Acetobacter cibinongensis]GAN60489.1 outer membrane protein [Acetobacter cibinongensis]GBQ18393.1 hypothetical protein AA0482_2224 [Acetobacter cibinongensis NRIC 0482]GEL58193.1 hypothetical protein ACI01nite_07950 [Acetobacter cibinongensis]
MARKLPANPSVSLNYGSSPDSGWGTNGTYTAPENSTITITDEQSGDTVSGETSGVNVVIADGTSINGKGWTVGNTDHPATVTVNGNLTLTNADAIANGSKVVVSNGGTLILGGYATTTAGLIQFDGTGGTVEIAAGTTASIIGYITNIQKGDTIIIDGLVADNYVYTNGVYTLTDEGQAISGTSSFQLPAENEGTTFIVKSVNGKTYLTADTVIVCFLGGSMLRTPEGDMAVETLQIGDEVVTFDWQNNKDVTRRVVWVGTGHVNAQPNLPDDQSGYPVRILKGALSDGVPYKDLLITSEHCLFFEGKFIPARMLVNGISIFYDKTIQSYNYYHIETEHQSVITANGMLTESYLDTGNRLSFQQPGKVVTLHGKMSSWEKDAAAPLCVERNFVETIFHTLKQRSLTVTDNHQQTPSRPLTPESDLHIVTDNGQIIRKIRTTDHTVVFMLPANIKTVRLVSRTSRPCDTIGPFVDDRRKLGVLVGAVTLLGSNKKISITSHLDKQDLQGWHGQQVSSCRWTNGDATLSLGEGTLKGFSLLTVEVLAAGPYSLQEKNRRKKLTA